NFEISTDDGTTWFPLPSDGVPAGDTVKVRLTWPDEWGLPNQYDPMYEWRVRAFDWFEYGSYSSTWKFQLRRSYTISGQLQDDSGAGLNSKTVRLYINGQDSGATATTATIGVAGRFNLSTTAGL